MKAAELVYYGMYDCEFSQTMSITQSPKHSAYVDVKHGKNDWLMKPVLSSTGAIRLEDVRGETLMVQIASKSMLLNVKSAHRIVDDCISPRQRELIAEAKAAKGRGSRDGRRLSESPWSSLQARRAARPRSSSSTARVRRFPPLRVAAAR